MEQNAEKPRLAMWDYQNIDEDFERRIIMNVTPLMSNPDLSDEEKQNAIMIMDQVVKSILSSFNVMPKTAEFENKIRKDSEELDADGK